MPDATEPHCTNSALRNKKGGAPAAAPPKLSLLLPAGSTGDRLFAGDRLDLDDDFRQHQPLQPEQRLRRLLSRLGNPYSTVSPCPTD